MTFNEDTLNRLDGWLPIITQDSVEAANYSAVEVPSHAIRAVIWQQFVCSGSNLNEALMCKLDQFQATFGSKIQAQTQFDHGTNYKRIGDSGSLARGRFSGELEATKRVGLPEVDAGAKPVVFVGT